MKILSIAITLVLFLQGAGECANLTHESALRVPMGGGIKRARDLAEQERPHIRLMDEEDIRVLRLGYVVELSSPEGSESYTIIKAPIDETKHPNVRFVKARDGKKAWLIFNMNAWQFQVYEKLADKNIPGLLAGKLFKDDKGHPYFVSSHVSSKTLTQLLEERRLNFETGKVTAGQLVSGVKKDVARIAYALHSLHDMGIVYGDVHPENIMDDENGELRLLPDFGRSSFNDREGGAIPAHRETDIRGLGEIVLDVLEKTDLDRQPELENFLAKVKRATNSEYFEKEGPYKDMADFAKAVCDIDISMFNTGLTALPLNRETRENL